MKIGQLADRSGLSVHTIRYYERIGLMPPPARDAGGRRDYDPSVLDWTRFLDRLKATGMPIREMRRYAALRAEGPATGPERRALLVAHRAAVRARIAALTEGLAVLDAKIESYPDPTDRNPDDD